MFTKPGTTEDDEVDPIESLQQRGGKLHHQTLDFSLGTPSPS